MSLGIVETALFETELLTWLTSKRQKSLQRNNALSLFDVHSMELNSQGHSHELLAYLPSRWSLVLYAGEPVLNFLDNEVRLPRPFTKEWIALALKRSGDAHIFEQSGVNEYDFINPYNQYVASSTPNTPRQLRALWSRELQAWDFCLDTLAEFTISPSLRQSLRAHAHDKVFYYFTQISNLSNLRDVQQQGLDPQQFYKELSEQKNDWLSRHNYARIS